MKRQESSQPVSLFTNIKFDVMETPSSNIHHRLQNLPIGTDGWRNVYFSGQVIELSVRTPVHVPHFADFFVDVFRP